jgi:protein TonB
MQVQKDRLKSGVAVAVLHGLIGYALLTTLGAKAVMDTAKRLQIFNVAQATPPPASTPPPPEAEKKETARTKDAEGAASPANLKDTPSPIVAPPPKIKIEVPPPVVAARVAGTGTSAAAGAADVRGPGTGSGGVGTGLGSGLHGSGTGGGGGGRPTPARLIRGGIYDSDYPQSAFEAGISGRVHMRFTVAPDGRVRDCRLTRSSGNRALDETTCRLIKQRFRYAPARDARGQPVSEVVTGVHEWEVGYRPEAEEWPS